MLFAFRIGVVKGFVFGVPPVADVYQWKLPVAVPVLFKLVVLPAQIGAMVGAAGLEGLAVTVKVNVFLALSQPPFVGVRSATK